MKAGACTRPNPYEIAFRMEISALTKILSTDVEFLYIIAGLATFLSVMLAWKYTKKSRNLGSNQSQQSQSQSEFTKTEDKIKTNESVDESHPDDGKESATSSENDKEEAGQFGGDGSGDATEEIDPVEYSQHIPAHIKRAEQKVTMKKIEEGMTAEQKEHERQVQMEQMAAIFKLMQENKDTFGVDSMDEVQNQMKLYM